MDWSGEKEDTCFHKPGAKIKDKYTEKPKHRKNEDFKSLTKKPSDNHPYLKKKGISATPLNLREDSFGNLIVPIFNSKNNCISHQEIGPEGFKKFKHNYPLEDDYHFPIGTLKDRIYICEGVATGATIHNATGHKVYCALAIKNLDNLTKWLLETYPKKRIILCLDNDGDNTHKTTITDKRLEVVVPDLPGDFNDHQNSKKEQNKLLNGQKKIPEKAMEIKSLLNKLGYKFRLNERSQRIEIWGFQKEKKWQDLRKGIRSHILLEIKESKKITKESFEDMIETIALSYEEDPFKTYLERIQWDGTERLKDFLSQCFKIEGEGNKALAEWSFKSILLAVVYRTFHPGWKHDEFVIFRSQQGLGKSSLFYHLLEDKTHFTNSVSLSSRPKEIIEVVCNKVLVEIAELSGFKKIDIERMKSFISTQHDDARLAYRRDAGTLPRRFICIGTTNDLTPLPNDITGLRRFVMVVLKKKKSFSEIIDKVKKDRDKLWAEAVHCFHKGDSARLPENLWGVSANISEEHRGGDLVFESKFLEMINGKPLVVLSDILYEMKMGREEKDDNGRTVRTGGGWITNINNLLQAQANELLIKAGYKKTRKMINGLKKRVWLNKEVEEENQDNSYKKSYGKERPHKMNHGELLKFHKVKNEEPPLPEEAPPF